MKNIVIPVLLSIPLILFAFTITPKTEIVAQDWSSCITKVKHEWGGHCLNYGQSEDKFSVYMVNTCTEKVDLMCCVQKDTKSWQCFHRNNMLPKDTLMAHVCKGTGKFRKWVRAAGDKSTTFPTDREVNLQFRD